MLLYSALKGNQKAAKWSNESNFQNRFENLTHLTHFTTIYCLLVGCISIAFTVKSIEIHPVTPTEVCGKV